MSKKEHKSKIKNKKEQQYKNMITRFGTDCLHVDVNIAMTFSEMKKTFGKQCEEYEPCCVCCRAWLEWNTKGKVTVVVDRADIIKLLEG